MTKGLARPESRSAEMLEERRLASPGQMVFLLADDVRFFLEMQRPFFERKGISVLIAQDGAEALRLIREKQPHIAILDYLMPELRGDEVCKQAKADPALRTIPFIIVTAESKPSVIDQCLAAGCDDVIAKPVEPGVLLEKVLRLLALPVRSSPRIPVRLELTGEREGRSFVAQSLNISEGGLLIDADTPLQMGEIVTVNVHLPGEHTLIIAEGEVVREARPGLWYRYGIRFRDVEAEGSLAIRRFIEDSRS